MAKTNYNKMSNKPKAAEKAVVETSSLEIEQSTNEIVEPVVEESMADKPEIKTGVVVNCEKLNVRTNPHPTAHVELIIDKGTEVEIVRSEGDFYFVRKSTATEGFNGWCMKKYISVK
jgi:uncharacterized protein YgiM (DUF1202 family)